MTSIWKSLSAVTVRSLQDCRRIYLGEPFLGTTVRSGSGDTYVINDAGGRGFRFGHYRNAAGLQDGIISVDEGKTLQGWYPTRPLDDEIVALTCRTFTDILVVGHASAPGITTDFDTEAREAAWTSFSELLISAASDLLMVERRELEVGIRRTFVDNKKKAEIFLADALENGAGYAVELARLPRFRELMKLILDDGLADRFAEHRCDSACYLCLKNYENMRSHGILDWRLALDLANVIAARPLPDRRAFAIEQALYFCEVNKKSGFWSEEETWTSEVVGGIPVLSGGKGRIAIVPALLETAALPPELDYVRFRTTAYDVVRRPLEVALFMPQRVQSMERVSAAFR